MLWNSWMTDIMHITTLTCLYVSFRVADTTGSFLIVPPVKSNACYSLGLLFLTGFQYSVFHREKKAPGKDARVLALIILIEKWGSSKPLPAETDREFCSTDAL